MKALGVVTVLTALAALPALAGCLEAERPGHDAAPRAGAPGEREGWFPPSGTIVYTYDTVDWTPSGPMTGAWEGHWSFHGRAAEGTLRVVLRHYDVSFNGTVRMTPDVGAVCGRTRGTVVAGRHAGGRVRFGFADLFSYGIRFVGTLSDDALRGGLTAVTPCGTEHGTFEVRRAGG